MINPVTELRSFFVAALVHPVDRDHTESPEALVQRRWISAVTLAVGSFMLAWTLRLAPGDPTYYAATLALAVTWIVGGLLSGKTYFGTANTRSGEQTGHGIFQAVILGVLLLAVLLGYAALVAPIGVLRDPLLLMLVHTRYGLLPVVVALTVLNSVGEELFFRGALYSAVGGRQAMLVTTLVYALATIPTGIPMMILSAALLGIVTGLQRRVTGGVTGPIITHLIWAFGLLFLLPMVLGV